MQYLIAESSDPAKLARTVSELLQQGWTCQGGIAISRDQGSTLYAQALVK